MHQHQGLVSSIASLQRLALMVIVLVIGHDVMMTSAVHESADAHGDHAVVQQCGPTEGALALTPLLPTSHAPAAFIASSSSAVFSTFVRDGVDQIEVVADASERRAMLQVFLN